MWTRDDVVLTCDAQHTSQHMYFFLFFSFFFFAKKGNENKQDADTRRKSKIQNPKSRTASRRRCRETGKSTNDWPDSKPCQAGSCLEVVACSLRVRAGPAQSGPAPGRDRWIRKNKVTGVLNTTQETSNQGRAAEIALTWTDNTSEVNGATMLRLGTSRGRTALKTTGFICTSCRGLLAIASAGGATRTCTRLRHSLLQGAATTLGAARHHYSTTTDTADTANTTSATAGQEPDRKKPLWAAAAPPAPAESPESPKPPPAPIDSEPSSQLWQDTLNALSSGQPAEEGEGEGKRKGKGKGKEKPAKAVKPRPPTRKERRAARRVALKEEMVVASAKEKNANDSTTASEPAQVSLAETLGFSPRTAAAPEEPPEKATRKATKTATKQPAKQPAKKTTKKTIKKPAATTPPAKAAKPKGPSDEILQALQPSDRATGPIKTKKKKNARLANFVVNKVDPHQLHLTPVENPSQRPVPKLAHGLDRVLFNPGVYHIQDPRSRVFNFDPYLERIMPVDEFDFGALKQYVTSSKDTTLIDMAAQHKMKYTGSTSSMTSSLSHFHFLLSAWRPIDASLMSRSFEVESERFTRLTRGPSATFLHLKDDGVYAIDADKEFDTANILSMLGKSMEKLLTLPKEEFEKYRKTNSHLVTDEERNSPETFHYTTLGDFMMRSQLDAHDSRLPGTGMFDLKTRAVITVRMDAADYHKGRGYEVRGRFGQWESFEREYYDMIRSAFLKYSLQVRMGRMDGIFVAFHNTERIFGFQYIPLPEMDQALHGQSDVTLGDREFKLSVHLLNKVLDKATAKYPGRALRLHFETRGEEGTPFMYIFAKPVTPDEITRIQEATRVQVEEFEARMMGAMADGVRAALEEEAAAEEAVEEAAEAAAEEVLEEAEEHGAEEAVEEVEEDGAEEAVEEAEEAAEDEIVDEAESATESPDTWEDLMAKVDDQLEDEEHGATFVRQAVENALREAGLLRGTDEDPRLIDAFFEALITNSSPAPAQAQEPVDETEEQVEESAEEQVEESAEERVEEQAETQTEKRVTEQSEEPVEEEVETQAEEQAAEEQATEAAEVPVEEEELGEEAQDETESPETADEPTLKDLIVKVASQIRATAPSQTRKPLGENDEENAPAQAFKRKIEEILSQLTKGDEAGKTEGSKVVERGAVSSDSEEAGEQTEQDAEQADAAAAKGLGDQDDGGELYGLVLTIRNKVNDKYVVRPTDLAPKDRWTVEYAIEEVDPERAHNLYQMLLKRRKNVLDPTFTESQDRWHAMFRGRLEQYSKRGRAYRCLENRLRRLSPVHVYGVDEPVHLGRPRPDPESAEPEKKED